jgi:hypothetical protein
MFPRIPRAAKTNLSSAFSTHPLLRLFAVLLPILILTSCSSLNESQFVDSTTPRISITGMLPLATIKKSYAGNISVTGGIPPYRFKITSGNLPPGLRLHRSSGKITGVPRSVGSFEFGVAVMDERRLYSGGRELRLHVLGKKRSSQLTIQVSPSSATMASLASQQFTAFVRGASQTDVTWSASSGTISGAGLFTAPTVSSTTTVIITATSNVNTEIKGSSLVTVIASTSEPPSKPNIETTSLPLAVAGSTYNTTLSATGGHLPYQWSLVSGSLPAGIQFSGSDGRLSGTAKAPGRVPFTAKITDKTGSTAVQSQDFLFYYADACGPPT